MDSSARNLFINLFLLLLFLLGHSKAVEVLDTSPPQPITRTHKTYSCDPSLFSSSSSPSTRQFGKASQGREGEHLTCISSHIGCALLQAKLTKEKIDEFKDRYVQVKFNDTWAHVTTVIPVEYDEATVEVCTVDQTCSTVLPSLPPSTTPPPTTDSDAAKTLMEIAGHIARFVQAFGQLLLDQAMNEDNFAEEINDAYNNHVQLLYLLENVLDRCGLTADFSNLAALHGKMYVSTSSIMTKARGFCTIRQSLYCLDLLENMFGDGLNVLVDVMEEIIDEAEEKMKEEEEEEKKEEEKKEEEEEEEEEEEASQRGNRTRKNRRFSKHGKNRNENKKGNKKRRRMRNYLD